MPSQVWDKITYPFSTTEAVNGKVISPTLYDGCNDISMLGLKLIHVCKRDPWSYVSVTVTCLYMSIIDLILKSHNASVPYPRMQHSEQKCAHFCSEWCIVGYGALCIVGFVRLVYMILTGSCIGFINVTVCI